MPFGILDFAVSGLSGSGVHPNAVSSLERPSRKIDVAPGRATQGQPKIPELFGNIMNFKHRTYMLKGGGGFSLGGGPQEFCPDRPGLTLVKMHVHPHPPRGGAVPPTEISYGGLCCPDRAPPDFHLFG